MVRRKRRLHARNRRIIARRKRLRCRKKPLGSHPSHRLSSKTARYRRILRVGFRNRAEQLSMPEKRRQRRWRNKMSARACPMTTPPPRFMPRVFRTNPSPDEGLSSVIYNCKMAKTHFCSYGLCRSPHLLPASQRPNFALAFGGGMCYLMWRFT